MNAVSKVESYDEINPTLRSPNTMLELPFYQTSETLNDITTYSAFLKSAINRFHTSRFYTNYKGFLYSIGLDRSAVHGNINTDVADIEMHHNMLTIFDIAFIICEHVLRTRGYICTFDLVRLLKKEHAEHHVLLVMLDVTSHQAYHANNKEFFIHPSMCFGDWITFLNRYYYGLTREICNKIINYIDNTVNYGDTKDGDYLKLRDQLKDWSFKNV